MNPQDSRQLSQLAALLSSPAGAGLTAGMMSEEDKLRTGLSTGGGSLAGLLGGGALGAGAGGALGGLLGAGGGALLSKLTEGDFDGDTITGGAGLGAMLGGNLGALVGAGTGSYLGAGAGHDLMQKENSAMSQQEINYAFAIGALEKMAEYDVSPAKFVEAATQSNHQGMRKIATAVVELDGAVQREKQAAGGRGTAMAHGVGEGLENLGGLGKKLQDLLGHTQARNAAQGVTDGALGGPDELLRALQSRNMRMGGAAAGGLGALGLAGGAGAYGAGDADTYGNQARGLANDNLGTDFDMQSRLAELLGR